MPRSVRILEGPLFGGTWIVAALAETRIVETRIVLSGTRVAFGSPRSATIIRDWAVAAHTIIVLDRPVAVRYRTAIVDWSIAEALTGFTACTVVSEARILSGWCLTLISEARIVGHRRLLSLRCLTLVGNRTTITNWATIGNGSTVANWAAVIDGALLGCTGIVACVTLIGDRTAVVVTFVRNWSTVVMTLICNGLTVMVTVVAVTVVTGRCSGACTCGSSRTGSSRTCGCTGCVLVVAASVHVGIQFISALELAFLLKSLLLSETIAFSGVSVQLLSLGGLALGFRCLHFGVGVGLLRLCLAMLGVGFAGMDFMLGFGCLLTDPCCFLALVFALLSCGLTTDRNDDADDNQNNDDRYDYPDNGSCTHALSPCCLFGSH